MLTFITVLVKKSILIKTQSLNRGFKMKYLLIAVLVLSASSISMDVFAAEQKIIFCAEGYKYGNELSDIDSCQKECFVKCELNGLLSDGWKIDTKMAKEITKETWKSFWFFQSGCTCTGTEYVLSKEEKN
jgi:hypothetical protein